MEPLMTTEELCRMLKVKESFLRGLRYQGRIPYLKVGGLVRYQPDDIAEWLKSGQSARIIPPEVERKFEENY